MFCLLTNNHLEVTKFFVEHLNQTHFQTERKRYKDFNLPYAIECAFDISINDVVDFLATYANFTIKPKFSVVSYMFLF